MPSYAFLSRTRCDAAQQPPREIGSGGGYQTGRSMFSCCTNSVGTWWLCPARRLSTIYLRGQGVVHIPIAGLCTPVFSCPGALVFIKRIYMDREVLPSFLSFTLSSYSLWCYRDIRCLWCLTLLAALSAAAIIWSLGCPALLFLLRQRTSLPHTQPSTPQQVVGGIQPLLNRPWDAFNLSSISPESILSPSQWRSARTQKRRLCLSPRPAQIPPLMTRSP